MEDSPESAEGQEAPREPRAVEPLARREGSRLGGVSRAALALMEVAEKGLCYVGAAFLIFIMVMTSVDIVLRYVFLRPLEGSYELVSLMMVPIALFGVSEAQARNIHIRVVAVQERLPMRARLLAETLSLLIMLGIAALLTWQAAVFAMEAWRIGDTMLGHTRLPTWHGRGAVAVAMGCLSLRLALQLVGSTFRLLKEK